MSLFYHPLRFNPDLCDRCMACLRACPVQAIRIREGGARMLGDRCIDCGECIKRCPRGAIVPLTHSLSDLSGFDCTIAIPSPALYTQFEAPPRVILAALRLCGFDDAVSLSATCEAVAAATEMFLAEYRGPLPLISSFCSTVIRLVQESYADLVEQVIPVITPRELAARDAKERKSRELGIPVERIGAVYITPCPSKMVALVDHPGLERSNLDAAVSIRDLYQPLAAAIAKVEASGEELQENETGPGVMWAYQGARPRSVPSEISVSVAGLSNVIRILDDVEKGRLRQYSLIEAHACPEGCISGSLLVENPYVARAKAIGLVRTLPERALLDRSEVERRYRSGELTTQHPTARPRRPLDEDVTRAIAKMNERDRLEASLPGIDCGACGAPSCEAFAEDVVLGAASETDCVFVRERRIAERVEDLTDLLARQRQRGDGRGGGAP